MLAKPVWKEQNVFKKQKTQTAKAYDNGSQISGNNQLQMQL